MLNFKLFSINSLRDNIYLKCDHISELAISNMHGNTNNFLQKA